MNTQIKKVLILGALATALAGAIVACGDSSKGTTPINPGDGDGDTDAGGDGDTITTDAGGDGDGDIDAGGDGDTDAGTDGGVKKDCFEGTPKKMEDFLNRCTDAMSTDKTPVIPKAVNGVVTHINNAL